MKHAKRLLAILLLMVPFTQAWAVDILVPGDFATVQQAIDDSGTVAGDTIIITLDGHVETDVHVTKALTITASPGVFLHNTGGIGFFIDADDVTLQDMVITGGTQAVRFYKPGGTVNNASLVNVVVGAQSSRGIEIHNDTTVTNLLVQGSVFDGTYHGLRVSSSGHLTGSRFIDTEFKNLNIGIYQANDGGTSTMQDTLVSGCLFENNWGYGIFFEEIQDALIENNTFLNNRRDIQIFKWYQASVPVSNVSIINNTMTGTQDAVFAIFNAEHSSGQTVFDRVIFAYNTAVIDPVIDDNRGAVYAGAHSGPGLGGTGWDTVVVACNSFLQAQEGEAVRFWAPGDFTEDQYLGGASLRVAYNWWGTAAPAEVDALMQIPAITDYTPYLTRESTGACFVSGTNVIVDAAPVPGLSGWGLVVLLMLLLPVGFVAIRYS